MKISIITASYNYEDYIKESIESVLDQSYPNWELIIIDDGSSDNSLNVIKGYAEKDSRIKVFTHEGNVNKGLAETVKLGISKTSGEYIAFLESDDIWTPDYLDKKAKIAKQYPKVALIFNDIEMFGDESTIKEQENYFDMSKRFFKKIKSPQNIFNWLLCCNFIPTFSCAMVKKETLEKCTLDTPFSPWLDWNLWLQLSYKNDFYYLPECLTKWRMHKKSYINTSNKTKRNNNNILKKFVENIFSNETNPIKKFLLVNYYTFLMLFFKINRGLIRKMIYCFYF